MNRTIIVRHLILLIVPFLISSCILRQVVSRDVGRYFYNAKIGKVEKGEDYLEFMQELTTTELDSISPKVKEVRVKGLVVNNDTIPQVILRGTTRRNFIHFQLLEVFIDLFELSKVSTDKYDEKKYCTRRRYYKKIVLAKLKEMLQ